MDSITTTSTNSFLLMKTMTLFAPPPPPRHHDGFSSGLEGVMAVTLVNLSFYYLCVSTDCGDIVGKEKGGEMCVCVCVCVCVCARACMCAFVLLRRANRKASINL